MKLPKYIASVYAASLPLGNIMAYISSRMDNLSSGRSSADVPPRFGVVELGRISNFTLSMSNWNLSQISSTIHEVIIFVKLATYLITFSCFANRTSLVLRSIMIHERAVINGAGLSRLKYLVIDFKYSIWLG